MSEKCIVCGSSNKVNKHHIVPVLWQGNDRKNIKNNKTINLCFECHLYMSPHACRIDKRCHQYGRYTQAKANRICHILNEKTPYHFKVDVSRWDFKTVPSWTCVTVILEDDKHGVK